MKSLNATYLPSAILTGSGRFLTCIRFGYVCFAYFASIAAILAPVSANNRICLSVPSGSKMCASIFHGLIELDVKTVCDTSVVSGLGIR